MARPASVSDAVIFQAVQQLTGKDGVRPTPYALRKALALRASGRLPSYSLIQGALHRLDELLARGQTLEALVKENEDLSAAARGEADVTERLTLYVSNLVRPLIEQVLTDAESRADTQQQALSNQLDDVYLQRDTLQTALASAESQLLAASQARRQSTNEISRLEQALTAETNAHAVSRAKLEGLSQQLADAKTVIMRDREALERHREDSRRALTEAAAEFAQRDAVATQKVKIHEQTIAGQNAHISALNQQLATAKQNHHTVTAELHALKTAQEQLTVKYDDTTQALATIQEQLANKTAAYMNLQDQAQQWSLERGELKEKLKATENLLLNESKLRQTELAQRDNQIAALQKELQAQRERSPIELKTLLDKLGNIESKLQKVEH